MEYFGSDFKREQLEAIGLQVDPAHRVDLPDLMRSRWFAYRGMHPVQATYLFAALYKAQTKTFAECFVDIETAEDARAFAPDDIFKSRDMTGMWLARSTADRVGCPYETLLRFAQRRALDRTFQRFPRPNQLYGEDVELDLADEWKATCSRSLQYCKDDHFKASRYQIHDYERWPADVRAHTSFLVKQIAARSAPRDKLLGRMFHEDRLSPSWNLLPFTGDELARAERHAAELGVSNR
jgi:hypothetical protein